MFNGYIGNQKLIDQGVIDPSNSEKVKNNDVTQGDWMKPLMRAFGDANGDGRVDQDEFNIWYEVLGTYVGSDDPLLDMVKF